MNNPLRSTLRNAARPSHAHARIQRSILAVSTTAGISLTSTPALAQTSVFGGRLCAGFQAVVNSEMISVVLLVACVGALALWLLDDGQSKIKVFGLRLAAGVSAIFGVPTAISMLSGRNLFCTIGM